MHPFLESLYQDHKRVHRLLNRVEKELDKLAAGEDADFELLEFGIDYCVEYLDLIHHQKEEDLARYLEGRAPDSAEARSMLSADHAAIESASRRLSGQFTALHSGALTSREGLVVAGRDLLHRYRAHLEREEGGVFRLADRCLLDEDWSALQENWQHAPDPLLKLGDRYQLLLGETESAPAQG